jgi:hypothetical protein
MAADRPTLPPEVEAAILDAYGSLESNHARKAQRIAHLAMAAALPAWMVREANAHRAAAEELADG